MKDHLLEMLFDLFEKGLNQLKKYHCEHTNKENEVIEIPVKHPTTEMSFVSSKANPSLRIISHAEQVKMTKTSYQFLMRIKLLGILSTDSFEHIMNILQFSDSRIVTINETRWAIRKVLGEYMDKGQLAFLDLILHSEKQTSTLH